MSSFLLIFLGRNDDEALKMRGFRHITGGNIQRKHYMFTLYDAEALAPALRGIGAEAAELVRTVRAQGVRIYTKEDGAPVTDADLQADELLKDRLNAVTPSVPYYSEESPWTAEQGAEPDLYWLADPVDATTDLIRGGDAFTVNVALIHGGVSVMGMVAAPMRYHVYYTNARGGASCFREEEGAVEEIRAVPSNEGGVLALIPRSKPDPLSGAFVERLYAGAEIRYRAVAGALKLAMVAEGAAHCYPRLMNTARSWDIAAGHAVLNAAGGRVVTHDGELRYALSRPENPPFLAIGGGERNEQALRLRHACGGMGL